MKDKHIYWRNGHAWFQKLIGGKMVRRNLHTTSKTEARIRRDTLLAELTLNGDAFFKKAPLFVAVMCEWYDYKKTEKVRPKTLYVYSTICQRLEQASFINKPIDKITDFDLEEWSNTFSAGPKTVRYYMTMVSQIFKYALKKRYITSSPMNTAKRPKIEKRTLPDPFTADEKDSIIRSIPAHYQDLIIFKFDTGVRTSEACGLKWNAVDFVRGVVVIKERLLEGEVGAPKNAYSHREVRMLPSVKDALIRQRTKTLGRSDYVFTDENNQPLHTTMMNNMWTAVLKKAGIRHRPIMNTRHTFISMALMSGANPMAVARMVGQRDTSMIHKHYEGYIPKQDDFERIASVVATKSTHDADNHQEILDNVM